MKRTLGGSDNSLIPICSSAGEDQEDVYDREFHPIMEGRDEEDGGDDELCGVAALPGGGTKKRRLSTEQVRALEKNFEVENKLEPERKVRLAKELGLQPRQVAVWFQNRRARWKTKQLEREYAALKTSYDALRLDFDFLHRDKESLLSQVKDVKAKLAGNDSMSFSSVVKQEPVASETAAKAGEPEEPPAAICKDETSDSDNSSAVVNDAVAVQDENSPQLTTASDTLSAATLGVAGEFGGCSSMLLGSDSRMRFFYDQHHEILKVEEEEFLSKPCSSFFADEPAPALGWYYSDHWS